MIKIKNYSNKLLENNIITMNDCVKQLIDPRKLDISPILVHFDDLKKAGLIIHTELERFLKIDQDFYRAFITRM